MKKQEKKAVKKKSENTGKRITKSSTDTQKSDGKNKWQEFLQRHKDDQKKT